MLQLDPDDPEDEEGNKALTALSGTATASTPQVNASGASVLTEADQVALSNYKVGRFWLL